MGFHLTQALSGHRLFEAIFIRFTRLHQETASPVKAKETMLNIPILFQCTSNAITRQTLQEELGYSLTVGNLTSTLVESGNHWNKVESIIRKIMEAKIDELRLRSQKPLDNTVILKSGSMVRLIRGKCRQRGILVGRHQDDKGNNNIKYNGQTHIPYVYLKDSDSQILFTSLRKKYDYYYSTRTNQTIYETVRLVT